MPSIGKVMDQCNREIEIKRHVSPQRSRERVRMYLRIKPLSSTSTTPRDVPVYRILDSTTISTEFPSSEANGNNSRRAGSARAAGGAGRHAFTRIFGSESSQAEVFERSIKHRIADFLDGESSTIMAYGTRDSGKTYTLFGTPASPGVIPRSIELVFSAINCTLMPWYKPTWRDTVLSLDETAQTMEARRRAPLLGERLADAKRVAAAARRSLENSQPADAVAEGREEHGDGGSMYAVWLSFAEIYNGNVYDLLDGGDGGDAEAQRPSADSNGRVRVRDLRAVYATTALEAFRILGAAQSRLSAVATPSNPASSRSHGIFTMRLMRYRKERAADEVTISTLAFCDLAGSRQFAGDRRERWHAREASHINGSLLVLGKCLKAVSQNRAAPFRESKLTRIFQHALSGQEDLTLIINVVFAPNLYAETRSTFGFCAAARKLLAESREASRERSRELEARSPETTRDNGAVAPTSPARRTPSGSTETGGRVDSLACGDAREQNKRLIEELDVTRRDILNREYTVRQELADYYSRVIDELEATHGRYAQEIESEGCDLFKWSVRQIECFYKERIDSLARRKKRKRADSGDHAEDNRARYVELEAENARVTSVAATLKETLRKLRMENQAILCEGNKRGFELALATVELKKFRELARAGIRKWGNGDYGDVEDECLANNLERLIDEKIGITETKPEETADEHVRAMKSENVEAASAITKRRLLRSGNVSDEAEAARTRELEEELARKEAYIVTLERRVQTQEEQLAEIQRRTNENARDRKRKRDQSTSVSFGDCTVDSFFDGDTPVSSMEKNSSRVAPPAVAKQRELDDWIAGPTLFATRTTHVESPKKRSSNVDRGSFLSCSMDCNVSRSSDRSSKDDSGIGSESQSRRDASMVETEDKCTQTYIAGKENSAGRLETDRSDSTSQKPEETSHLAELSRELEIVGSVIRALDEAARANEREIDRESQLPRDEEEDGEVSGRLTGDERRITIEQGSMLKAMENKAQGYRAVDESSPTSTLKEENENRSRTVYLKRRTERSKFLENQLLWMRGQLDRMSDKCEREHLPRIERLEEEVSRKTRRINELDGRIARMQRELAKDLELFEKVDDFEIIVDRWRRDKHELYRQLHECSQTQLTLEDELTKLTTQIAEREKRLALLRNDVTDLNVTNNEEARRLSESIRLTDGESRPCEDPRENLENVVRTKIDHFRFRFPDYQHNNVGFLDNIWRAYDDSQDEITRLNLQLRGKERRIILLKNDRDIAVQKFKTLRRYVRSEIDGEKEKIKAVHPNALDNPRKCLTEKDMHEETDFLKKFRVINNEKQSDVQRTLTSDLSLISKRINLEALDISPVLSEDFTNFSDEKESVVVKFDDIESCETENSVGSILCSCLREANSFVTEINSNMRSPNINKRKNMSEWMKVRRIHGKTTLSHLSSDNCTDVNSSDSEDDF